MLIIRMMQGAVIKWGKGQNIWHQDLLGHAIGKSLSNIVRKWTDTSHINHIITRDTVKIKCACI